MLLTKLVVRLLGATGNLLGWTEVVGTARGDGCLWVEHPATVVIEEAGMPVWNSVHWCDINVEVRTPIVPDKVLKVGDKVNLDWANGPALRCGPAAGGLPPVTVREPIMIGLSHGSLRGNS